MRQTQEPLRRTKHWDSDKTCQLEALPPDVIATLLREAIWEHIDPRRFQLDRAAEKTERLELTRLLAARNG